MTLAYAKSTSAYAKSTSAHARECPNHRDNHLCSPALRAGEHEKISATDTPFGFQKEKRPLRTATGLYFVYDEP